MTSSAQEILAAPGGAGVAPLTPLAPLSPRAPLTPPRPAGPPRVAESRVSAPLGRRQRNLRTVQMLFRHLALKQLDGLDDLLAPGARIQCTSLLRECGEPEVWHSIEARFRSLDGRGVGWRLAANQIAAATDDVFVVDGITTRERHGGGFATAVTLLVSFSGDRIATIDAFERRDQALRAAGLGTVS